MRSTKVPTQASLLALKDGNVSSMKLLQLSDLHFVPDLMATSSVVKSRSWLAQSHDIRTVQVLSLTVARLRPDFLVITGDLSTDGSRESLEAARDFINARVVGVRQNLAYPSTFSKKGSSIAGLNGSGRSAPLPGN